MNYTEFLQSKEISDVPTGFDVPISSMNRSMKDFQKACTQFCIRRGRALLAQAPGLGKTLQSMEWASHVRKKIGGDVLFLAPLAVAQQTAHEEAPKFGYVVNYCKTQADVKCGLNITNYERLDKFTASDFSAVVADESSIIANYAGKIRNQIIEMFAKTPYKLSCTATPAPNDYMELGNQAEFLGVMSRTEMLCTFFYHDGSETSKWTIKGHAKDAFWKWVASWAIVMRKPSDIGFSDEGYDLPPLRIHKHILDSGKATAGYLLPMPAQTLADQRAVKKDSLNQRCELAAKICSEAECSIAWAELNPEGDLLENLIKDSVQVAGADKLEEKESRLIGFCKGTHKRLVSKASIAGFGLNMQHCNVMAFANLTHSNQDLYQAIRRCYRFGQTNAVDVHLILTEAELPILENLQRKEREADEMAERMVEHMADSMKANLGGMIRERDAYKVSVESGTDWTLHLGDCCEIVKSIPDESIHLSVFSPPFESLYTYSNSNRDMGNCGNSETFMRHFKFLVDDLFRITMPGRLCAFHCMDLPMSKERDGVIGFRDFRGALIRLFEGCGWIMHQPAVTIWKDPVTAMQRTKALGLLHKQIKKDSCMSRMGAPDYLCVMRKPGQNPQPVAGRFEHYIGDNAPQTGEGDAYSIQVWQRYASPVWMDIKPSDTLDRVREQEDEKHICALQLQVIERALELWSNPGDLVFSPFSGIGSEGYVSIKTGRKFIGCELKPLYWQTAVKNIRKAESELKETSLFSEAGE